MSDQLYLTRLWWDGHYRTGTAAHNGERKVIDAVPKGLEHAIALDYAPVVEVRQLQTAHGPMRDMTRDEMDAAAAYLEALFPAPAAP